MANSYKVHVFSTKIVKKFNKIILIIKKERVEELIRVTDWKVTHVPLREIKIQFSYIILDLLVLPLVSLVV